MNLIHIREYLKEYKKTVLKKADSMRDSVMPPISEEEFAIYENTGNRLIYEKIYFERRRFLAVYGIASMIEKRKEDINKLEDILSDICDEFCWALPAHVNRKKDADWNITIDLFAAETAQALSMIITHLKDELNHVIRDKVIHEINRRVFTPYYNPDIPLRSWEHLENNWCAVCSGCIGSAALYLLSEDAAPTIQNNKSNRELLDTCIQRVCNSLAYYIKGFENDGVCMEGLLYYTYGMTYYMQFSVQLAEYTNGGIDLLKEDKLKNIALFWPACYFNGGRTVSFSDGSSTEKYRIGLAYKLSESYKDSESTYMIPDITRAADFDYDTCYRFAALWQDYVWTGGSLKRADEKHEYNMNKSIVFHDSQWVIKENKDNIGFAAKGGHNGESHNHNDVGSFLYVNGADMLLSDLGAGEYTKDYFGEKRYDTLCCRSLGHNIPLINGSEQSVGDKYKSSGFHVDENGIVRIEFGTAYEKGLVKQAVREFDFNYDSGNLQVTDLIYADKKDIIITENLVTQFMPEIKNGYIYIYGSKNGCRIHLKNNCAIKIISKTYINHEGIEENVWLLQWTLHFIYEEKYMKEPHVICFIIEPLK